MVAPILTIKDPLISNNSGSNRELSMVQPENTWLWLAHLWVLVPDCLNCVSLSPWVLCFENLFVLVEVDETWDRSSWKRWCLSLNMQRRSLQAQNTVLEARWPNPGRSAWLTPKTFAVSTCGNYEAQPALPCQLYLAHLVPSYYASLLVRSSSLTRSCWGCRMASWS